MMKRLGSNKKKGAKECRVDSMEDKENNGVIGGQLAEQSNDSYDSLMAQIKPDLVCVVCLDSIWPKVLQCRNGHLFCQKCDQKLNGIKSCPTCRVAITHNIRNLIAEKLVSDLKFDCKYSLDGCGVRMKCADKTEHEQVCPFRPYKCPHHEWFGCQWIGHLEQIIPHLASHKLTKTRDSSETIFSYTDLLRTGRMMWSEIIACYSHHFLVVLLKTSDNTQTQLNPYQMYVQFVGDTNEAKKFAYELEIKANKICSIWQSSMDSIRVASANMRPNSFNFDKETVKLFSDSIDTLKVHVKIIRE